MSASLSSSTLLGNDLRKANVTDRKALPVFSRLRAMPESVTHEPDKLIAGTRVTPAPAPTNARIVVKTGILSLKVGLSTQHSFAERENLISKTVPIFKQQKFFHANVINVNHLLISQRVLVWQCDPERLIIKRYFS